MTAEVGSKTWGPEIWEDKAKHHSARGVILGTGASAGRLTANTEYHVRLTEKFLLPMVPAGGAILDVGTGPAARFAIEFARKGFQVVGLDGSKTALESGARQVADANVTGVRFIQADFAHFDLKESFDAIFCVETFFHLPGHAGIPAFLSFHRHLKPGGLAWVQFAVLNEITPVWLLKGLMYMTAYRVLKPIRSWFKKKSFYVTVTRHSDAEVRDLAKLTGFTVEGEHDGIYLFRKTHDPKLALSA